MIQIHSSSGGQKSKIHLTGLKVSVGMVPSESSEGRISSLFPASRGCLHFLAHGPFDASPHPLAPLVTSATHSDLLPPFYKGSVGYTGPPG